MAIRFPLTALLVCGFVSASALAQTPPPQYSADAIKERLSGVTAPPVDPACATYEARISDPKCAAALESQEQLYFRTGKPKATATPQVTGTIKRPPAKTAATPQKRRGAGPTASAAATACVDQVADEASGLNLCVTFALGSADLTPQAKSNLDQFAKAITDPQLATLRFAVEGHADRQGSDAINKTLSEKRAASVVAYLNAQGIAPDRLTAAGFGSERPVNGKPPTDPANRRVEARLIR